MNNTDGTVTAALLLERETVAPLAGAGPLSVIVPPTEVPPLTEEVSKLIAVAKGVPSKGFRAANTSLAALESPAIRFVAFEPNTTVLPL